MALRLAPALPLNTDFSGFIDGNFDFWSIATSFSVGASSIYTSDMWVANAGTGGAATISLNVPTVGNEPTWMTRPRTNRLQFQQTTSASTSPILGQRLESVRQYAGQTIVVSGTFAAAVADTLILGVQVTQNFGTGGFPSASVITQQLTNGAITTSEGQYLAQIAVPSIAGKTIGTNNNDFLQIDFLLATGKTFTLYCSQLQIDQSTMLPFRYRGITLERHRCQRYLYRLASIGTAQTLFCAGIISSATGLSAGFYYPTSMRSVPSFSFSNIASSSFSAQNTVTSISFSSPTTDMVTLATTSTGASYTAGQCGVLFIGVSGAGGFLQLDARL